jgi:hypothetical protein
VRVQHAAVVEREELVLPHALDCGDAAARERRSDVVGERAPRDRMMGAHGTEAPANDRRTKAPDRGLDLGQLGHDGETGSWAERADTRVAMRADVHVSASAAAVGGARPQVRCAAGPPI